MPSWWSRSNQDNFPSEVPPQPHAGGTKPALNDEILGWGKLTYCANGRSQKECRRSPNPGFRHAMLPGHIPLLPGWWRDWGQISFSIYTEMIWVWGCWWDGGTLHYHLCFCCHWYLLRPSQSQNQTQIKTMMFRESITYHTTSSSCLSLPCTGLVGHPGLPFALSPFFTPFTKALLSTPNLDVNASVQ